MKFNLEQQIKAARQLNELRQSIIKQALDAGHSVRELHDEIVITAKGSEDGND